MSIFIESYALLLLLDLGLHTIGLDRVCSLITRNRNLPRRVLSEAEVDEMARLALGAYRWYRPDVACLHRALTLYCLLTRRGASVELCFGVKTHPFAAHSWVEYQSKVVGDSGRVKELYRTIKRID